MVVWLQSADSTVAKRASGPEVVATVPTAFPDLAVSEVVAPSHPPQVWFLDCTPNFLATSLTESK